MSATVQTIDHASSSTRPPAPTTTAAVLTILVGLFGGYGAIYFTGLGGFDADAITFVTTYEAIVLFALVSAVALLRGSEHGRIGVICYGLFNVGFTAMKLITIQEQEAVPFGVVGLVVLALAMHPRTRQFTGRGQRSL